jgi:DNA-binding NarL/FixJ family response regulator/class 3 adenylate cyclase
MTTTSPHGAAIRSFMIADIRGYTSYTQAHGDQAAARLATAFAGLTRDAVEEHGGELVELRGDEALTVFSSARDAIGAAVLLQQRFVAEAVRDADMPLLVGIGLDVGEAVPVEGGYRGGALNVAARLCSLAAPGEILASQITTHLAGPLDGVDYEDRGRTRLKGLSEAVPVVRICPVDDPIARLSDAATSTMSVVVADDSVLLREGVVRVLKESGYTVVAQAEDGAGLVAAVDEHLPQVVVTDIRMPPTFTDEGLRAAHDIRARHPQVGVLLLSQYVETDFAVELVSAGAARLGYLLKDRVADVQEFTDAVRRVATGGSVIDPEVVSRLVERPRLDNPVDRLTPREQEVLRLMAEGRSNAGIAEALVLSPKSVEGHVRNIFGKLDLADTPDDHRRVLAVLSFLRQA